MQGDLCHLLAFEGQLPFFPPHLACQYLSSLPFPILIYPVLWLLSGDRLICPFLPVACEWLVAAGKTRALTMVGC